METDQNPGCSAASSSPGSGRVRHGETGGVWGTLIDIGIVVHATEQFGQHEGPFRKRTFETCSSEMHGCRRPMAPSGLICSATR